MTTQSWKDIPGGGLLDPGLADYMRNQQLMQVIGNIGRTMMLAGAGGDPEAKFMETVNGHLAEHGDELETKGE